MRIPWKLKSKVYRFLSYCPQGTLYFMQRHVARKARIRFTEPDTSWKFHHRMIEQSNARTLIEFGAGKSLIQNLFLTPIVDFQTLVDLVPMINFQLVNEAIVRLREMGVKVDGRLVNSAEELENIYKIRYLAPLDMRMSGLEAGSFDLCISTNTLEHIPKKDIEAILVELKGLLTSEGSISAVIDYSDHYSHTDPSIGSLNFLQFAEGDWEKLNHSNHYQNRLRHTHFGEIFECAGFDIVSAEYAN